MNELLFCLTFGILRDRFGYYSPFKSYCSLVLLDMGLAVIKYNMHVRINHTDWKKIVEQYSFKAIKLPVSFYLWSSLVLARISPL